jgi:Protein of unknown function (DUF2795)
MRGLNVAELQVLVEGVVLPANRQELVDYARREGGDPAAVLALERLPPGEYASIDDVAEALAPVQPAPPKVVKEAPRPESGPPPGATTI